MSTPHHKRSKSLNRLKAHLPKLLIALLGTGALVGGIYLVNKKSPEDHLQAGIALQEKGDLKGAAIELKNALQAMPGNTEARVRLGKIHFGEGDYLSAEKEFKKARELGLRDSSVDLLYARTLLQLAEFQRLLDEIRIDEGIEVDTHAALLALRARAQFLLKDTAAAEQSLSDAETLSPEHPEALFTRALLAIAAKDTDGALALVERALSKANDRAEFWLFKGNLLRIKKNNELALQAYSKALEGEPANIQARLARAQLHLESSDLDKAAADLKELRKHAPNNVVGRYLEAFIEFKHSRHAEANNILQGVLRGAPDYLPGHMLAGTVNIALGNREAARFHLEKVLGAAPNHPLARKLMAATLADLGDLDRAKQLLASFGNSGDDALLNTLQGQIALRQGDYAEARKHLEQVHEGPAQSAQFFTALAASRMGSGDKAGAVSALGKAAELDTGSARPEVLLVMAHLKEKRFAEALKVVDTLEKERPSDPLIHNLRGAIYSHQRDIAKARTEFAKALDVKPDYFPAASNLALLDMGAKDAKSARSRFQQLLKHNPKEDRAWVALAELDVLDGNEAGYLKNLEEAKKANEKALQPRALLARYWLGKNDPAKALVEARSAQDVTGRVEFSEFIGLALAAQGDHTNALATFKKWAEASPGNPTAAYLLAQEQAATGDNAGALKSLDKALALHPDFAQASLSKALLLGRMGRGPEGIKIARNIQAKAPTAAAGYLTEAEILFGEKKYAEAARLFAKGAPMAGQGQPLARAYEAYARAGQAGEGEKLLQQWLATHPNDLPVRHQLALALLKANRLKDAAEHYRAIIRANPRDIVAYNNLAWLLGEIKAPDAMATAEQAYRLNPDNPEIMDTLGWILVHSGQSKKGIELLTAAHNKKPEMPEIHWHLAAALAKAGERSRAIQELENLFTRGMDFPQKEEARKLLASLK